MLSTAAAAAAGLPRAPLPVQEDGGEKKSTLLHLDHRSSGRSSQQPVVVGAWPSFESDPPAMENYEPLPPPHAKPPQGTREPVCLCSRDENR
ncbi:hypothetical protein MTO96_040576 [Rhipicephalus appendiculatus]